MTDRPCPVYRFGDFELDVQKLRLTVGGENCALEPKSFRLLQFLIENRGRVVSKEEIVAAVWPDTFVSDNSITRAVTQIRKALDDDPREPKYIETVPTVGYRFVGECVEEKNAPAAPDIKLEPSLGRRDRWRHVAAASVGLALIGIGAAWWMRRPVGRTGSALPKNATYLQLTDQPGQELYPSLAPDGKSFVYAGRGSGNWDIYSQRVGGKNPVNLTQDSSADDTQPAFSPDGEQIAFRSERDGGGIFVMGATGENVKRITDFGYDPVWSPDGGQIVCDSVIADPARRLSTDSRLFSVNVTTGEKHPITPPASNAEQPAWSPHGFRVAYWAQVQARMDVWTIPAGGGDAVRVTSDATVNWNPVWSPDGAYLYFASDRGGSMNVWRVPIDEQSGKVAGEMEPVTTPSPYAGSISFSRTGRQMAYVQSTETSNIYRVKFDSSREVAVGPPVAVTQGTRSAGQAQLSVDGEWVTFDGANNKIFIVRPDGSGLRQLTEDSYNDRRPNWSPDGKLIAFHSNRGGKVDIWTIRPDGGGLHQLTDIPGGSVTHPVWSPDGKKLVYSRMSGTPFVIDPGKPWASQSPQPLPPLSEPGTMFEVSRWSPDGSKVAGFQIRGDGIFNGIGIYSFETGKYTRITDFGLDPDWLQDGRRLIFTRNIPADGEIYLVDSQTRKMHSVFSVAPNLVNIASLSHDNRWIYFNIRSTEADIWLANLQ